MFGYNLTNNQLADKDNRFTCNCCKNKYLYDEGFFMHNKYFLCDACFNVFCLMEELECDDIRDLLREEIETYLIETDISLLHTKNQKIKQPKQSKNTEQTYYDKPQPQSQTTALVPIIQNQRTTQKQKTSFTPRDIKSYLDKFAIGQHEAKKTLAVAVYNHYIRISNTSSIDIPKNNIVFMGNTGVGKTFLIETVAKMLDIPFVSVDTTQFTPSGWKGSDLPEILSMLLKEADDDLEKAQNGIVLLDEFDKIATGKMVGSGGDINGRGLQQTMLKMVEGGTFNVEVKKKEHVSFNTHNILFIGAGAFIGMDEIINNRINPKSNKSIGFCSNIDNDTNNYNNISTDISHEDLINFGFLPELAGRFPHITKLHDLTQDDLLDILVKPYNSIISQYMNLFNQSGISATFSDEFLEYVTNLAIKEKTGARSLKTILGKSLFNLMYDLFGSNTKNYEITLKDLDELNCEEDKINE